MDDNVEIIDNSTTRVLPDEMLSQIFAFLPLVDRKRVRLTCRLWYACCTSVNITKHEKFVFRTDPGAEHIAEVMLRSSSLLSLEFERLPSVKMLPANVWKACGQRIRKLAFHKCDWDYATISNIILHCENLTSLVINENKNLTKVDIELIPIAYSPHLLNDFMEKGIQRPKLHTLSIFIKYDGYESVVRQIFLLHPYIKHFTVTMISHDKSKLLDPFAIRFDKCLSRDTQLESLTPKILTPKGWTGTLVDQTEQGLRLKYLKTCLVFEEKEMTPTMESKILNFFRLQRNLEVIRLWSSIAPRKLFYNILESCPNLREFDLNSSIWYSMALKPSEVSRFIASISKLKSLAFCFQLDDSEQALSFCDILPNNVHVNLTSLDWRNQDADSDFCDAFLQRCSSLKHLRLHDTCCDSTLQTIFQYLPKLQTLVLEDVDDCTDFGFTGRTNDGKEDGYSIKRLQQLRHLKLLSVDLSVICLTCETVLELQLPHLESLSLDVKGWYAQLTDQALNHFASHLPELRVLAINPYCDVHGDCSEDTIPRLCKQLNNLNLLILDSLLRPNPPWEPYDLPEFMEQQSAESIFGACSSLRYISDNVNTFTRDPFTGKVLFKLGRLKFPGHIFE